MGVDRLYRASLDRFDCGIGGINDTDELDGSVGYLISIGWEDWSLDKLNRFDALEMGWGLHGMDRFGQVGLIRKDWTSWTG